ncbi:MAG: sigma-70 family RNA polymerase sigma factor, partial [Candidatus Hydrogenedentales bacterium]
TYAVESNRPDPPATGNERLDAALARIEPDQRMLLELFYVESFSIREIGEITGSPVGSVKSRLYRARQELRRLMEESHHE